MFIANSSLPWVVVEFFAGQRRTEEHQMTSSASGDHRILGSLRSADGGGVVRMEDRFDTRIDNVWSAITEPHRLARWLGEVEGNLRVGGEFRARFYASGWEGTGQVEACDPPHRLLVVTKEADAPKEGPIEVTLTEDGGQTIVVWEERGKPMDLLAAYGAGIQLHVEDLADHVAGRERRDSRERFGELFPAYQELAKAIS